jgi:hypothetical protein
MVNRALCLLLLVAGCYEDRYECDNRDDCDLGQGGRCEVDGYCSQRELTCATLRQYTEHSGVLSKQCFDDAIVPLNACAGGQPPARRDGGCFTQVCDRLPTCCDVAWTDACVQVAQETASCGLACDTRIAITAVRNAVTERWDVKWTGTEWTSVQRNELTALAWVAPAAGTIEPRLAGATDSELIIGDTHIPIDAGRVYGSITSIGFDRDRRDTIVTAFNANGNKLEVWKLDTRTSLVVGAPGTVGLGWGEENRDTYPDAVVRSATNQYSFLHNIDDENFDRRFLNQTTVNVNTGGTPGAPAIRSFDWIDFNADTKLDLAMFGADIRIHTNEAGLNESARIIDCDPPTTQRACSSDVNEPNLEALSFAGAALPTAAGPSLVFATFPDRRLYRTFPNGDVEPLAFPGSCSCGKTCTGGCPGPDCSCTYNCNTCVPVLAIVARDVDYDHVLDLIAIDAKLQLYIAKASNQYTFGGATGVPTAFPNTFYSIDVSVSGAPIP